MVRFNPLVITARNGFLLAMKLNLKKMASRLKWAYATREQAAAKGVSTDRWEKAKKALSKIEKLFADKLQGKKSALKNAILKGRAKGINGLEGPEEEIDIRGLGFAPAVALAAAIPVITAVAKIMTDTGLMKKSEAHNIAAEVNAKASEADSSSGAQASQGEENTQADSPVQSEPASSPAQEVTPTDNTPVPQSSASQVQEVAPSQSSEMVLTPTEEVTPVEESSQAAETEATPEESDSPPPSEGEGGGDNIEGIDGILDIVQSKPFLIAGGIGLGIWGLSWLLGKKEKPAHAGLSGPARGRKKKKKKPSRHKTTRRKTVRAITLR